MHKYLIWAKISETQSINTFVWASNAYDAKLIAEAQFGVGNVLNYTLAD
jgi:hypothetical protein